MGGSSSSESSSGDERRKKKKEHKKKEKKERKRERKREKKRRRERPRAEAPLEEATADVAGREFCSALRLGHAAEVAALLQSRPGLLRMRICLPGESELVRLLAPATVWSVVHEAVFRCTTTGERMGTTALARLSERGAVGVLASVLRSCDDQSLDASRLVPTDADDAADADADVIDGQSLSAHDAVPPKRRRASVSSSSSAAAAAAAAAAGGRPSLDAPPADWLDSRLDDSRAAPPPPNQRARVVEEAPLHVAAWRGSQPAVEMLLIAGADLLAPSAASGLLPVHVACDPRSPAYQQGDGTFLPWLLRKMGEADAGGAGPSDVAARLRADVPAAFWSRGCDPAPLGIAPPPSSYSERVARRLASYRDLDNPLGEGEYDY